MDEALDRPHSIRAAGKIVELRFFGGLTVEQTADLLGISPEDGEARVEFGQSLASRRVESEL